MITLLQPWTWYTYCASCLSNIAIIFLKLYWCHWWMGWQDRIIDWQQEAKKSSSCFEPQTSWRELIWLMCDALLSYCSFYLRCWEEYPFAVIEPMVKRLALYLAFRSVITSTPCKLQGSWSTGSHVHDTGDPCLPMHPWLVRTTANTLGWAFFLEYPEENYGARSDPCIETVSLRVQEQCLGLCAGWNHSRWAVRK